MNTTIKQLIPFYLRNAYHYYLYHFYDYSYIYYCSRPTLEFFLFILTKDWSHSDM